MQRKKLLKTSVLLSVISMQYMQSSQRPAHLNPYDARHNEVANGSFTQSSPSHRPQPSPFNGSMTLTPSPGKRTPVSGEVTIDHNGNVNNNVPTMKITLITSKPRKNK